MARAREEEQQEYDREEEQQGYDKAGEVATAFPPGRPDMHIRWDPRAEGGQGAGVWNSGGGAGYDNLRATLYAAPDEAGEQRAAGTLRDEPLTRMLLRYDEFEAGGTVMDARGTPVSMDEHERKLLYGGGKGQEESWKVASPATMLHIVHHFTDVAATDGSKGEVWAEGRGEWETRVACGVYEGAQPGEVREGESGEEAAARWVGEGMWGMGLPAWFEVMDAELMGVLAYLERVVERAEAEGTAGERRVLVLCDCKGAMTAIETAWRGGGVEELRRTKRGGILEAICRMRAKLGLVVFMYTPAHRGASMSAYADAVAKAYLQEKVGEGIAEWLRTLMIRDREGREFGYELGMQAHHIVAPWHDRIFEIMRDTVGAWVRGREAARVNTDAEGDRAVLVDTKRLGIVDAARNGEWWGDVVRGTGAAQKVERGTGRTEQQAKGEAERARMENERCGLGAAMRNGGELRQVTHGRWHDEEMHRERERGEWGQACRRVAQGCPACCSKSRGWGWRRDDAAAGGGGVRGEGVGRMWRRSGEPTGPVRADTKHVVGGRCRAVEVADSGRKRALAVIARMRKEVMGSEEGRVRVGQGEGQRRQGSKARKVKPGLEGVVEILDGARAAMAGEATDPGREDRQWRQWRQLLAGMLPKPGGEISETEAKKMAKAIVEGVISLQKEVVQWVRGWEEAGRVEGHPSLCRHARTAHGPSGLCCGRR